MSALSTPTIVKNDMKFIRKNRTKHPNKKICDRLNVLWLTQEFGDAKYIALLADVSARQIFNIIKIYKEQGMGGILALRAMESRRLRPVVRSRRRFLADRFAGTAKAPDFSLIL